MNSQEGGNVDLTSMTNIINREHEREDWLFLYSYSSCLSPGHTLTHLGLISRKIYFSWRLGEDELRSLEERKSLVVRSKQFPVLPATLEKENSP